MIKLKHLKQLLSRSLKRVVFKEVGKLLDDEYDGDDKAISKTERKRRMHDIQALGESLIKLSMEQLKEICHDEQLLDAIQLAKQIRSREALRRQKQYIGKLMRKIDIEGIVAKMASLENDRYVETAAFHEIEQMRTRLLTEGKEAIGSVIERYPFVDSQKLRQLVKRAKTEQVNDQGMTAQRALFRFLRKAQSDSEASQEHDW